MRKIIIIMLMMFIGIFNHQVSSANEYVTYQDITFEHSGMVLLDSYSNADYDKYYDKISKKRFWGWRTYEVYKTEEVYFTKDTLWVIENEGFSNITETFTFNSESSVKKQYNVSGTLGLKGSGDTMGIKLGLEEELSYSITATTDSSIEQEFTIKVIVDPNTKLFVEIKGEGKVSNGVAKYFRFWRAVKKGGWEVFLVTTEYYSIRKVIIDESLIPEIEE